TTAIEGQPVEGLIVKLRSAVLARETTGVDGAGERRLQGAQASLVKYEGIDLPIPSAGGDAIEFHDIHPLRHPSGRHQVLPFLAARGKTQQIKRSPAEQRVGKMGMGQQARRGAAAGNEIEA